MTMPTRRQYQAGKVTTLTNPMTDTANSFTITDATNWPDGSTGNFWVTVDPNTASEERILCSSRSSTTVTVASSGRGKDGTIAIAHANSAVVWPSWSAQDADEANAHVSATGSTGSVTVHGLAVGSNVVGTTDTQTLTNKTLSGGTVTGATISSSTFSGGTVTGATVSGATVTGSTIDYNSNTITNLPGVTLDLVLNNVTGTAYTLALTDSNKLITLDNAATGAVTIPTNTSVAFPTGSQVHMVQKGTGPFSVTGASGVTVNGTPGLNFRAQWSAATAVKIATDTWILLGDLS
jgi:hypothetical protein